MAIRNAIVTGANRGLGFEFVLQLLTQEPPPANIIAATRSQSDQLTQLQSRYSNLHVLNYDATNYEKYPLLVQQVKKIVGDDGVDLLINNAGIFLENTLESVTPAQMMKNIEVNAVAPLILTQSLLPLLRNSSSHNRKTTIANVSSLIGSISRYEGGYGYSYSTSKAALNMVSKALSVDLKGDGIIVLALRPGWVQTDMGGPSATLTPAISVSGMLDVIRISDLDQSGSFISYDGLVHRW